MKLDPVSDIRVTEGSNHCCAILLNHIASGLSSPLGLHSEYTTFRASIPRYFRTNQRMSGKVAMKKKFSVSVKYLYFLCVLYGKIHFLRILAFSDYTRTNR